MTATCRKSVRVIYLSETAVAIKSSVLLESFEEPVLFFKFDELEHVSTPTLH